MVMRDLTISRLHTAYADGLEPSDVIDEVYAAIAAAGDPGIFLCLVQKRAALEAAKALGTFDPMTKPLWGVPFAVKDNIDVARLPTTAACPDYAYVAKNTAFAVQRLLDAGAILIGKTNLDQFATGLVGVRTPYPVPRNAIDPTLVPGGSSSGSAVAVARGLVAFALGTDTAGSGRVPAALNNIVGLKPSLGAISTSGVVPACRTLDCVSVFGLTVDCAWRALAVMTAFDAADPYSRAVTLGQPSLPPQLRIGVPSATSLEFFGDTLAATAFEASLMDARAMGAEIVTFDFGPFREVAQLLYGGPWVAERYQAIRAFFEATPAALHPTTRGIIGAATSQSAADAFAGQYKLAALRRMIEPVWRTFDVMLVPSIPTIATVADVSADPIGPNTRLGTYTNFVNLLDQAALAVPGHFRADHRPAGITLIARRGQDALLAAVGAHLHRAAGVPLGALHTHPPIARPAPTAAPPGWIEIVMVGAHMAGLALNHELQALDAVYLRPATTLPSYKLFALPGGPPHRPGLLRVADGQGVPVSAEVWALESGAFGRFVATIPPPLGIGTLLLVDGTTPKGFLVEAQGVVGALDISKFGGWRAYLDDTAIASLRTRPA